MYIKLTELNKVVTFYRLLMINCKISVVTKNVDILAIFIYD